VTKPPATPSGLRRARRLAEAASIGIAFPVALGLGYLWGAWMDRLFGTAPYLTWIFSGFGVVAGFVNAFRVALRLGKEEEEEDQGR
jgi:F0F1-type ATP synthase assembly protein I